MSKCSNCGADLDVSNVGYQKQTFEGTSANGKSYKIEKFAPYHVVCGQLASKYAKKE